MRDLNFVKSVKNLNAINFILFQIGYFVALLSAAHDLRLWPLAYTALVLGWHFYVSNKKTELLFFSVALPMGLIIEYFLISTSVYNLRAGYQIFGLVPEWLICLWLLFLTCFRYCFTWVKKYYWLGAVCAGIGSPLSYINAGERWNIIERGLTPVWHSTLLMGLSWAVMVPLMAWVHKILIDKEL